MAVAWSSALNFAAGASGPLRFQLFIGGVLMQTTGSGW